VTAVWLTLAIPLVADLCAGPVRVGLVRVGPVRVGPAGGGAAAYPVAVRRYNGPQRKRLRLSGYSYAHPGSYFVTVVTYGRLCHFGRIEAGMMRLNHAGTMVDRWWCELAIRFPGIGVSPYVVMPNHLHGVITIHDVPTTQTGSSTSPASAMLPRMLQWFKTMTTNEYLRGVACAQWPPLEGKLWQRGYHDHIMRADADFERVAEYIAANPARWDEDQENPALRATGVVR
jgi:putative transposase